MSFDFCFGNLRILPRFIFLLSVQVGKVHVPDILDYNNMRGFVSTLERPGTGKVFALDCEMCSTTQV
jgi:hypothetical protein